MNLLQLKNISVHYGGVKAADGVDLELNDGEIVALMGPNGAGKSTVLKSIFGLVQIDTGSIVWQGKSIKPLPHEVVKQGISFVPQGRRVFSHLTVEENLEIGGYIIQDKNELNIQINNVMQTFPILREKRKVKSGALSGGQQQMLALARGLMVGPKVLLLDEPTLGLAPKLVNEIFANIQRINQQLKTTILIVEHNIKSLLHIVDRAYVLDKGRVVCCDKAKKLAASDILEKVFLGKY